MFYNSLSDEEPSSHDPKRVDPSVIKSLFDEDKDIFQDRPPCVPPDRGVGHTIRLEP